MHSAAHVGVGCARLLSQHCIIKGATLQTTIMAITIEGGVMLAADSRTSRGRFVSNRGAAKLTQVAKNIGLCRSGSAADTQAVAAVMQQHMSHHNIEHGGLTPVAVAANVLQSIVYANKDKLSAGMIVAGWDDEAGGQVYALPLGGTLLKVRCAVAVAHVLTRLLQDVGCLVSSCTALHGVVLCCAAVHALPRAPLHDASADVGPCSPRCSASSLLTLQSQCAGALRGRGLRLCLHHRLHRQALACQHVATRRAGVLHQGRQPRLCTRWLFGGLRAYGDCDTGWVQRGVCATYANTSSIWGAAVSCWAGAAVGAGGQQLSDSHL